MATCSSNLPIRRHSTRRARPALRNQHSRPPQRNLRVRQHAAADNARDGPREKQPRRDLADGIAGGIAKAAEIVGNIMEGFLSPETPQEKAAREALVRVLAETAPERELAEQQRELDNRQAAYEQQRTAQEKFDEYFARHGDRLRREEEERSKKDKDRDR